MNRFKTVIARQRIFKCSKLAGLPALRSGHAKLARVARGFSIAVTDG
jgi:hypothetical protein